MDVDTVERPESFQHARAIVLRVPPDPAREVGVEAFAASRRQVRPRAASVTDGAPEDAPQARASREVEVDDGVDALEARIACPEEVPVEDPALAGDRGLEVAQRFVRGRRSPAGAPEDPIEVDDGESGAGGETRRELALPRAAVAEDRDALQLSRSTSADGRAS